MDTQNFKLNGVFSSHAKEYQTRPVIAAKYQSGMENGFVVYFSSTETYTREYMMYEGIRFFPTKADAWKFINRNKKQYVKVDGTLTEIEAVYDMPEPVLYRKDANAEELDGIHFCFGKHAFLSDESEDYEFYILDENCWIIQEPDGGIRVWHPELEETFFGKEYICEKRYNGNCCDYVQVVV